MSLADSTLAHLPPQRSITGITSVSVSSSPSDSSFVSSRIASQSVSIPTHPPVLSSHPSIELPQDTWTLTSPPTFISHLNTYLKTGLALMSSIKCVLSAMNLKFNSHSYVRCFLSHWPTSALQSINSFHQHCQTEKNEAHLCIILHEPACNCYTSPVENSYCGILCRRQVDK